MIFWGLKFRPKGIFFGSMEDAGTFLGREKKGIFLGIVLFISSNQQHRKRNLLLVWDLGVY